MASQSRIDAGLTPTLEDPQRLAALAVIFAPYLEPLDTSSDEDAA